MSKVKTALGLLPEVLSVPFSAVALGAVALWFLVQRAFNFWPATTTKHAKDPSFKSDLLNARRRKLSISSENWAVGLWPSWIQVPAPLIQSVLWFKPEDTPTPEELAEAAYHGFVKKHHRMRSKLVTYTENLPEGILWKFLKFLGLVGDKTAARMAFEEHDEYLLPQDVREAKAKDKVEANGDSLLGSEATLAFGDLRGPAFILAKHIKVIDVSTEQEVWDHHIAKAMETDFLENIGNKALWEMRLYKNPDPSSSMRSCLVFCISHVIGDGISLMKVSRGFLQEAGTRKQLFYTVPPRPVPQFNSWADKVKFWAWDTWMSLKGAAHVTKFLFEEDTKTELKVGYYPQYAHAFERKIQVFEPLSFEKVNEIRAKAKEALNAKRKPTLNDLVHSLIAGTIATYLKERGDLEFVSALEKAKHGGPGPLVRIWTPYMFAHPTVEADSMDDLHNRWSMSSTPLPVAAPTPLARLAESQRVNTQLMISGHDARAALNTQRFFSQAFGWEVQGMINLRATTAHTATWSNVPGDATQKVAIWSKGEGKQRVVDDASFILNAPTPYFTSYTYDHRVNVNFCFDPALVRDPKRFAEIYSEQFNALAKEVGL